MRILSFFSLLFILTGCSLGGVTQPVKKLEMNELLCAISQTDIEVHPRPRSSTPDKNIPGTIRYFNFEPSNFSALPLGDIKVQALGESFCLSSSARDEKHSGKFSVRPGDWVDGGARSEISFNIKHGPQEELWYAWSFMIPKDFRDSPLRDADGRDYRQIIAQFRAQPEITIGETAKI